MAGSVNKLILVGNLGRDPEVRVTPDGRKVVILSLATSEQWRDKMTDERRERTEWHRIAVYNMHLGEFCEKHLKKGMKVYASGPIETRQWTDPQTNTQKRGYELAIRYGGELTILDNRRESTASSDSSAPEGTESKESFTTDYGNEPQPSLMQTLNDEIPF